jgi:hypothetical protein
MMSVWGLTCDGNVHDWYGHQRELSVFMIGTIRESFQPVPGQGVQLRRWKEDYYYMMGCYRDVSWTSIFHFVTMDAQICLRKLS